MIFHFGLFPGKNLWKLLQCTKHHFWPILPIWGQNRIFLKVLFLKFYFLKKYWLSIIVQNFKNTNKQITISTGFKQLHGSRDTTTDKHEFIGPLQLKPGIQELRMIEINLCRITRKILLKCFLIFFLVNADWFMVTDWLSKNFWCQGEKSWKLSSINKNLIWHWKKFSEWYILTLQLYSMQKLLSLQRDLNNWLQM